MASQEEVRQAAQEAAGPFSDIEAQAGRSALSSLGQRLAFGGGGPAAAVPAGAIESGTGLAAQSVAPVANPGSAPALGMPGSSNFSSLLSGTSPLGVAGQVLGGVGTVAAGKALSEPLADAVLGNTDVTALQEAAKAQFEGLPKTEIKGPGFDIIAGTGDTTYVRVNDPQAFEDFLALLQRGKGGALNPIPVGEGDRAVIRLGSGSPIARITLPPTEIAKNFQNFTDIENNLRAGGAILQNTPTPAKASLLEQALANRTLSDTLSTPSLSEAVLAQGTGGPFTEEQVQQGLQDVVNLRSVNPLGGPNMASIFAQLGNQINSPALTVTSQPAGNPARGNVQDMITVTSGSPHISGRPQAKLPADRIGQTLTPQDIVAQGGAQTI